MNEYVTEAELCESLQLSRSSMWSLRRRGLPFRRIGSAIRYRPDEVQEWIERNCQGQDLNTNPKEEY